MQRLLASTLIVIQDLESDIPMLERIYPIINDRPVIEGISGYLDNFITNCIYDKPIEISPETSQFRYPSLINAACSIASSSGCASAP